MANTKFDIGIIGGGQLARMLVQKGHELGLSILVFSESSDDPAAQVTSSWMKGSVRQSTTLKRFLSQIKVVTYESEFVLADQLSPLLKTYGVKSYPKVKHMSMLQQRWSQKTWLDKNMISTSPWINSDKVSTYADICEALDSSKFVIKKNMGGYDGYGTFVVSNEIQFRKIDAKLRKQKISYIAEKFIPFKRELAVTFARSAKGEITRFPMVESFQTDSRCDWVKGPIADSKYKSMIQKIRLALKNSGYVGVIAFELFDTGKGGLLVNEVAPRVHNSSHYTMNGFNVDQFSMHLLAVMGRKLIEPRCYSRGFAMKNLIGRGKSNIDLQSKKPVHLHWYGKLENRKGRKMGHINALESTPERALKLAVSAEKEVKL